MSQGRVPVAIVGAGNITSLRHIPALRASGRAELVGVIDIHQERAAAVCGRFGIPNHAADMSAAWFEGVRAVTIGVPPGAHAPVAKSALLAGKHVLLEKPFALRLEDARELVDLAGRERRTLAIVHNFQFARSAIRLKELIRRGKLGRVTGIFCFQASTADRRLPSWYEELPLGLFYDEAPHLLYLLRAFGGEVRLRSVGVTASTNGRETPAVLTAHLDAGGVPAVLYNNFEASVSEWQFAVYGSRAVGVIDIFRDVLVVLPNDGEHRAPDVMRTSIAGIASHLAGVVASGLRMVAGRLLYGNDEVVRRFLDSVESGLPPEGISAEDGLAILTLQHELIDGARSAIGGRGHP